MEFDALSWSVLSAAAAVALVHTALGPDHFLPFILLARARRWSRKRTLAITALCGLGHVASSLLLGLVGIAVGASVGAVDRVESFRGSLAGWALVAFGTVYAAWGLRAALRRRAGVELHSHGGHVHLHTHGDAGHSHAHDDEPKSTATFWTLFAVFVLGPCEPLIPLFLIPGSQGRWSLALWTGLVFALVTIATMLAIVGAAHATLEHRRWSGLERWSHSLAGAVIASTGLAVLFAGL
jgi:nickel/cobalt exporter